MVFLAFIFLVILAGVTHRLHGHFSTIEAEVILTGLVFLYPIFWAETLLRLVLTWDRTRLLRNLGAGLLVALIPPVRIAARSYSDPTRTWLPFLGWQTVERLLRKRLERFFSVPMIVIALMVLPLLILEYSYEEQVNSSPGLKMFLDVGSALIWTAFAVEFIVMVSVAEAKLTYCIHNWTDLAVVMLPLVEFMPFLRLLRLTRLMQLQQLGKMGRVYRLRGLLMKAWRAVLVLEVIQRLTGQTAPKRLKRLRELRDAKKQEMDDLDREIQALETMIPR